jgi:hypothetical protein
MQFFYDGQIRRYVTQIVRLLSNFVVRYGDGTLVRVPVMYGDPDRQVAHIINQNSENSIPSVPRIAVYITEYELNRSRIQEPTFVSKMHLRERAIETDSGGNQFYTSEQGKQFTVERLMPTPFDLTVKVDIWSSNTEQKLQIFEQILVLFNPSLEIQTTDNYIDWTSLSVVELEDVNFSSRAVPVGTNSSIDIASITLKTPTWLSPPAKVKKLGVVTSIINNVYSSITPGIGDYVDGLGTDSEAYTPGLTNYEFTTTTTIGNFEILVGPDGIRMFSKAKGEKDNLPWNVLLEQIPGEFRSGLSKIFLIQKDETIVVGTLALNPIDPGLLSVIWDPDTFHSNNYIDNNGNIENIDTGYDNTTGRGTFDAIVNPQTFNPKRPAGEHTDQTIVTGIRYLLVENLGGGVRETFIAPRTSKVINTGEDFDIINSSKLFVNGTLTTHTLDNVSGKCHIKTSSSIPKNSTVTYILNFNEDGPDAWKSNSGEDTIAYANDIITWSGTAWQVIFNAQVRTDSIVYQTNYYTGTQYKWDGVSWTKSFEGEYDRGQWRIQL